MTDPLRRTPAENHAIAMRRWAAKLWKADNYHLKASATNKYRAAVNSGKLSPGPCAVCGTTKNIHGHHEDYAKPLDVIWLCSRDHSWRHRSPEFFIANHGHLIGRAA